MRLIRGVIGSSFNIFSYEEDERWWGAGGAGRGGAFE